LTQDLFAKTAAAQSKIVRIGIQKGVTLFILRDRHTLEPALAPLGVGVTWKEFPAGPQLLEALNVGAIDFGVTGEAPPIFAQAAGAPLVYVGVQPSSPRGEAIFVPKDSAIRDLADLKGKRVALNKGSNVHYLLVRALESTGLRLSDIRPVYLPPADARAAFEQGSVDAWVIWDPFLAAALDGTGARLLKDGTGLAPNRQYLLASRPLVSAQPDVVRTILTELDKVDHWVAANQSEAATLLSPSMGLPVRVLEASLSRTGFGIGPVTPEIAADQQKIADTFAALGLIPARIDVGSAVWNPSS
jgi:sulfonate transport system substrate-binding protein